MIDLKITRRNAPHVELNTGEIMPVLGFGVALAGEDTFSSVVTAIENGYRMIDTAKAYGNEKEVGEAIRASGIPREDIFITTKLSVPDMTAGKVREAFFESLERLGVDYVDLYLLHWPVVDQIRDSWLELEALFEQGLVRNIGVSNFQIHHLESMESYPSMVPAINQIECHPLLVQTGLRSFCKGLGIVVEAWSPIGRAKIFKEPILVEAAQKYKKTAAQIVLRWHVQNGSIVVPKSVHEKWIVENTQIFDFELTDEDMALISSMNRDFRFGSDPDNFSFEV